MDNPDLRKNSSASTGHTEDDASAQKRRKPEAELAETLVTNLSQLLAEQAERDEQLRKQEKPRTTHEQTLVTSLSQVLAEQAEQNRLMQREEPRAEPLPSSQNTTESAGESFPQQPTSSIGWETASAPGAPVRRPRPLVVAFGLILVATLGGSVVLFRNARPPATPPAATTSFEAKAPQILNEMESDLQARRWTDVIDKSSHLIAAPDVSSAIRVAAQAKQARASQEARTQQAYERFLAAVVRGGHDEAIALYREIPDGSVYQPMAKERYDQILPRFVDVHLKAIETAGGMASCDEVRSHIEAILSVLPKHAEALAARERHCANFSSLRGLATD